MVIFFGIHEFVITKEDVPFYNVKNTIHTQSPFFNLSSSVASPLETETV
jgi:hypothetical protein